jgi:hypothetical protein
MSIFPKRTVAGNSVTIHWNLHAPMDQATPLCPLIRIGIIDPAGQLTMLFEGHVLVMPGTGLPAPTYLEQENKLLYLNKHTPLLLLASFLSGGQPREKLVQVLGNIQAGRHYYFTWMVPPDALPGKYQLLSEVHINGSVKYSGTAKDDFFYVEQVTASVDAQGRVTINNHSAEPVPVKLVHYAPGQHTSPLDIQVLEIPAAGHYEVDPGDRELLLVYNEERIVLMLHGLGQKRCVRNQQFPWCSKQEGGEDVIYVLPKEGETGYRLTGVQQQLWMAADGMSTRQQLRHSNNSALYDEMVANRLIEEIT